MTFILPFLLCVLGTRNVQTPPETSHSPEVNKKSKQHSSPLGGFISTFPFPLVYKLQTNQVIGQCHGNKNNWEGFYIYSPTGGCLDSVEWEWWNGILEW